MSGNGSGGLNDKVAGAIASVEEQQKGLRQWGVTISSTGRQAMVLLPADATDSEIAEFCGWILGPVMNTHREERAKAAGPRILVPQPGRVVLTR